MKIASDLLYRWIRAQGRGDSQPASQDLEIPPLLLPVVMIPGPLKGPADILNTEVQRETFSFQFRQSRAASSAAITVDIAILSRGLWGLNLGLQHHADFTSVPSAGADGGMVLIRDGTQDQILRRLPNIANVSQVADIDVIVLLDADTWAIRLQQGATGVGQTMDSSVDGICSRLN